VAWIGWCIAGRQQAVPATYSIRTAWPGTSATPSMIRGCARNAGQISADHPSRPKSRDRAGHRCRCHARGKPVGLSRQGHDPWHHLRRPHRRPRQRHGIRAAKIGHRENPAVQRSCKSLCRNGSRRAASARNGISSVPSIPAPAPVVVLQISRVLLLWLRPGLLFQSVVFVRKKTVLDLAWNQVRVLFIFVMVRHALMI
jgi:hypothetical protein